MSAKEEKQPIVVSGPSAPTYFTIRHTQLQPRSNGLVCLVCPAHQHPDKCDKSSTFVGLLKEAGVEVTKLLPPQDPEYYYLVVVGGWRALLGAAEQAFYPMPLKGLALVG